MGAVEVPLLRLDEGLEAPKCAYAGDAGVDLRSTVSLTLAPFARALVPCGIAIALPPGHAGLVVPRSGLAIKHGISIVNAPGLIDSNYRGEIKAVLINLDPHEPFAIERGDRIAQLVIVRVEEAAFAPCSELPDSDRGQGGFGSSGLKAKQA